MKDYFFLLVICFVCGCSFHNEWEQFVCVNDTTQVIDLSEVLSSDTLHLTDIVDELKLIKLQTNDSSVLGKISHVIFGDSCIYIHDNYNGGGVAIFDSEGHFIRRLPFGNGPNDVYSVFDIAYDFQRKHLLVNQRSGVKIFSSFGDSLVNSIDITFSTLHFLPYQGGYLFSQLPNVFNNNKYAVICVDSLFNPEKIIYFPKKYLGYVPYRMFSENSDGSVSIIQPYNNMVMSYSDSILTVKTMLYLGDKSFDAENIDSYELLEQKYANDLVAFRGIYAETNNYQFFRLEKGDMTFIPVFYNKASHQFRSGVFIPFDLLSQLLTCQFAGVFNDYFVRCFSWDCFASDFDRSKLFENVGNLSQDVVATVKNLNDDDNPLLILYKLKDIPANAE